MRPWLWKSCHPREEKKDLPRHGPASYDLVQAALRNSILCVEG
jgi:hypothetical protein